MKERNLIFKFIEKSNIDDVVNLMEEVNNSIKDKSIFSDDSKEDLLNLLNRGGAIIGVYDKDELIAFRSVDVPDKENNLSYDIKKFYIDPETVIINDSVAVHKNYRGMNLQNITRDKISEKYKNSKFKNRMSTISPNNPHSYKNTLESRYVIVDLKKKYPDELNKNGYDRFILLKSDNIEFEFTGREILLNVNELDKIKEVLEKDYLGVDVDDLGNILFKKIKNKLL